MWPVFAVFGKINTRDLFLNFFVKKLWIDNSDIKCNLV
jgi:hypothetical protein